MGLQQEEPPTPPCLFEKAQSLHPSFFLCTRWILKTNPTHLGEPPSAAAGYLDTGVSHNTVTQTSCSRMRETINTETLNDCKGFKFKWMGIWGSIATRG